MIQTLLEVFVIIDIIIYTIIVFVDVNWTRTSTGTIMEDLNKSLEVEIPFEESLSFGSWNGYTHAVHAMIFAEWNSKVLDRYVPKSAILMQLRFDGRIGFPGGEIDDSLENFKGLEAQLVIAEGLRRELVEESNINSIVPTPEQYRFSHKNESTKHILHFYCIKISFSEFEEIERNVMGARDWGHEVFGIIRPPLYTMNERENDQRGFPMFLKNNFAGNAKTQLIRAIKAEGILPSE